MKSINITVRRAPNIPGNVRLKKISFRKSFLSKILGEKQNAIIVIPDDGIQALRIGEEGDEEDETL